jgi:TM2 domain-containing membrane protein YozV
MYTYSASELLSLGVYIDINLNELSPSKTEINLEIRRKVGTFNESHEVTLANQHINKIIGHISTLMQKSDEEISKLSAADENVKRYKLLNVSLICFFFGLFGIHRFHTKNYIIGTLQLLTFGGCFMWWGVDLILIAFGAYTDGNGNKLKE